MADMQIMLDWEDFKRRPQHFILCVCSSGFIKLQSMLDLHLLLDQSFSKTQGPTPP